MRSNIASCRIDPNDGRAALNAAPLPQAERTPRNISWARACSVGRGVVLAKLGKEARPQLGRIALHVVPPGDVGVRGRVVKDQRPRSLRLCCREDHGAQGAITDSENGGLSEADGVHDGFDLGSSIIECANLRDRVR
jgi:hypothetical protein